MPRPSTPSEPGQICVEVCAAWPDRVLRQTLSVAAHTTVGQIANHPDLLPELRDAWTQAAEIGIFGRRCRLSQALEPGDRIELWRALLADPKEARRARVAAVRRARRSV